MDQALAGVVLVATLAVVVVVGVLASRGRFRGGVRGPGGVEATIEGERSRGVRLRRVRAGHDVSARGATVDARQVDAGNDAVFEDRAEHDPKA